MYFKAGADPESNFFLRKGTVLYLISKFVCYLPYEPQQNEMLQQHLIRVCYTEVYCDQFYFKAGADPESNFFLRKGSVVCYLPYEPQQNGMLQQCPITEYIQERVPLVLLHLSLLPRYLYQF